MAIGNFGLTGESSSGTGVIGISHLADGLVGDKWHDGGAGVFGSCDEERGTGVAASESTTLAILLN